MHGLRASNHELFARVSIAIWRITIKRTATHNERGTRLPTDDKQDSRLTTKVLAFRHDTPNTALFSLLLTNLSTWSI